MSLSFEVRETDLMGRIGKLTLRGKRLETPYLFPVVHPVRQSVPLDELRALGFDGLMTNSYILYTRRKEEAVRKGIHKLLDFDGVLMTDSGGYQVLEYGGLDLTYGEIAAFQSKIGSDLAVTLDRPTGYSLSRAYSKDTMEYSLKNAVATIEEYGGSATTWVGPVQGGLFGDLLSASVRGLEKAGFQFLALGSPTQVMENYRFSELVGMIVATRKAMKYAMPLHLFGAGHPLTMAMAVALGCDTFDSASYVLFARQGRYMTDQGVQKVERLEYLPCSCHICSATSPSELRELTRPELVDRLSRHNLHVLRKELQACKQAISEGRLWDLVESRATAHPKLYEAFLKLAKERELLELGTPAIKDRGLLLRGDADGSRPELSIAAEGLQAGMSRRSRSARLVLGAEQGSGLRSKKGRRLGGSDLYRFHKTLGLYPAELEFVFPFTQTVEADPRVSDSSVKTALKQLRAMGYSRVGVEYAERPKSRRSPKGASPSPRIGASRTR